jgi:hypothetical protein
MSKKKRYEYHANTDFSREELKERRAKKRAMMDSHKKDWRYNPKDYDDAYLDEEWDDDR